MQGGPFRRTWARDRTSVAVIAVASTLAAVAWRGITRPMVDTVGYRETIASLEQGWAWVTDRTVGYPLVMMATGAGNGSSRVLFFVQLAMHVTTVVLMLDVARRHGVGRWGRLAMTVLLFAPVVLLRVVHEGTEALSALQLTFACWLLLTPPRTRPAAWAVVLGITCGSAALVRPTFTLLFVPAAALAGWMATEQRWRTAALVAVPALVIVGGYVVANGVRFQSWSTTPNMAYNLNSRTSTYVEELPLSFEPGRSVLIRERDAALLVGDDVPPQNFIYGARPALEEATGLTGRDLDRWVLRADIHLITHNPFAYLDAVKTSAVNYANCDSQPAILGLGRPVAWLQQALHQVLLVVFVGVLSLVPGLALAGRVPRSRLVPLVVAGALAGYTFLVTVMVEAGTARLRSPAEPIMALMLVLAGSIVRAALADRTRPEG